MNERKSAADRKREKQAKAWSEAKKFIPDSIKAGAPILDYDQYGIPIMSDAPQYQTPQPPQTPPRAKTAEEFMGGQPNQPEPSREQIAEQIARNNRQSYTPPPNQQRQAPQAPPQAPAKPKNYSHPVLEKLRSQFGIRKAKRFNLTITSGNVDLVYTLTAVPEEIAFWALEEAQIKMVQQSGETKAVSFMKYLVAMASVVAIDNEPIWQILDLPLTPEETDDLNEDPLDISINLRKKSAKILTDMHWNELAPIGDKVWDFYEARVAPRVRSNLDEDHDSTSRFVCPIDGCSVVEFLKVEMREDEMGEKPYFCKVHGKQMVKTPDTLGNNAPLG